MFGTTPETNIKAVITADDKASSVLKGFGDNVTSFGNVVEKGLKAAAIGLAAATAGAAAFGAASIKAFSESQDLIAQTNAVLKSTGGIAGVTADQVTKLATALEKQTKFSDEDVRSVENLLLTFTAVGKDIFPQATTTVLDMAQALGEDTKSAAIQLGKALQDPILGVTALRRVGVNFNSAQQEVIKNLVETGKSAEAQQLILKELNKEFGGSAVAAGDTFAGQLAKLKNQFNNVQEAIGQMLVKALNPLTDVMAKIDWSRVTEVTTTKLQEAGKYLKDIAKSLHDVYTEISSYLGPKLDALWHTIDDKLVPALSNFWHKILEPLVPVIGTTLVVAIGGAVDILNALFTAITPVINFMADHKTTVELLAGAFIALKAAMMISAAIDSITVGIATLQLVTFPSLMTTIAAARVAFMTAFPIAGILADIGLVIAAVNSVKGAISAVNDTANAAKADAIGQTAAIQSIIASYNAGKITKATEQKLLNGIALPAHASGTNFAPGGVSIVGENGPELLNIPRGSQVLPSDKTRQAMQGSSNAPVTIALNIGLYAGSEQEKRKVAMELLKSLQDLATARSTTVSQLLGAN